MCVYKDWNRKPVRCFRIDSTFRLDSIYTEQIESNDALNIHFNKHKLPTDHGTTFQMYEPVVMGELNQQFWI